MSLKIGKRLKIARIYRGLTLSELGDKVGISKQSLSLYEKNQGALDLEKIGALAKELNFPSKFFIQDEDIVDENTIIYFRRKTTARETDIAKQKIKTDFLFKIYRYLVEYIEFPRLNIKKYDIESCPAPKYVADDIRRYWNLGNAPVGNLKHTLESNGIPVVLLTSDRKIDAYSTKKDDYCMVILNEQQSESRALFDMAHELGHILMHPWQESTEKLSDEVFKLREEQADAFASAFLLPEEEIKKDFVNLNPYKLQTYRNLKRKWKVSIQALIMRASDLGIIDNEIKTKLYKQISTYKWRLWEPDDVEFNIKNTLLKQGVELLKEVYSNDFIMNDMAEKGFYVYPTEVESLLGLSPNTLAVKKSYLVNLR
ncbi:helix-turn-helix domain-containing protein [Geovibrio ferrireducens]|uniref:helix-turn-helix domain-containing protein n=1 Tax=Geovibrio ferrireducens TaxID=46201 RepID=UPI0022469737|nr:XRE family transcriptional regulator [Geovibrio ferrireducens]